MDYPVLERVLDNGLRVNIDELGPDWRPPLQLTPYTTDRDEATEWMQALAPMGIEGIVVKRTKSRYHRGADWNKSATANRSSA